MHITMRLTPTIIIGFLSLAIAFNANAHDSDELDELENEIQNIKQRLSELESSPNIPKTVISSEGWKSFTNWRKLTVGMEPNDVREILGEPHRLDGGTMAKWYYQNNGRVIFYNGQVDRWTEPRE